METGADNKLNMSLDDIIKKERKAKQRQQGGNQGGAKRRVLAGRRNVKGNRSVAARAVLRRNRAQVNGSLSAAAAMRVVNRLVKRAIRQRANQSLINRAAILRRRATRRNVAVRPAADGDAETVTNGIRTVRGLRARREAATVVGSRLAGRLSGVSQRSRVIGARRQPTMVLGSPQVVRGRGISRMGQLVSDREAVVVDQREITRPARQQQAMRRAETGMRPRPRRQVFVQRRARPVIVEQRPVIVRRGGIRKRVVLDERPNVVFVRNAPRRQAQFRAQPVFERIQRVVNVRPRTRFIQSERRGQYIVNPQVAQMREALGIGVRQTEPQRFEPSSTFLQRIPVKNRRGRGFQTIVYE